MLFLQIHAKHTHAFSFLPPYEEFVFRHSAISRRTGTISPSRSYRSRISSPRLPFFIRSSMTGRYCRSSGLACFHAVLNKFRSSGLISAVPPRIALSVASSRDCWSRGTGSSGQRRSDCRNAQTAMSECMHSCSSSALTSRQFREKRTMRPLEFTHSSQRISASRARSAEKISSWVRR